MLIRSISAQGCLTLGVASPWSCSNNLFTANPDSIMQSQQDWVERLPHMINPLQGTYGQTQFPCFSLARNKKFHRGYCALLNSSEILHKIHTT